MENELLENKIQMRALSEDVKSGKVKAADAKQQLDQLRAKKTEIEKKIALRNAPLSRGGGEATSKFADIRKAMVEQRSITLNGTGAILQVQELIKELSKKTPLLEGVRKFYGANASTNIPIFSPTIAQPGGFAEGATNVTADTQAALGNKSLTPHAFVSLLPVSAETLNLGSVNFEAELPAIFADAFSQAFHDQIATGSGTGLNFKGIFTTAAANTNAIDVDPTLKGLRDLALQLQDYNDMDGVIIMHPSVYSLIMSDTAVTNGEDLYKEELIRSKMIEGVRVMLTTACPSSVASSACFCVGGSLGNYGLAIAAELQIEPLKKVGDTNTYFQASLFANGSPIKEQEFIGLKAL
jgi:HK97 family phage major capsid protein